MLTTGKRIKQLRKSNGYTQEKLAELCGVTQFAVVQWEADRGFPIGENIYKLSKIFGVSMNYIISGERVNDNWIESENIQTDKGENK